MDRFRKSRRAAVLVLAFLFLAAACSGEKFVSREMPDITLPDLDGKPVNLLQFKGQVVMLNFWATWCPPCQDELPDFIEIQDALGPKGLTIVAVSVDKDGPEAVQVFSRKQGINFPVLYAGEHADKIADRMGGIRGIPTTFLIDREGRIVKKVIGVMTKRAWMEEVRGLL
jgi:thiol-disulfide isomerase/thioredoxin